MKFTQQNLNWLTNNIQPNFTISNNNSDIDISFLLDNSLEHIDENDCGLIHFENVLMYSITDITKSAFELNSCRFSPKQIQWNNFYEIEKSNWKKDFPDNKILLNQDLKQNGLSHYILLCGEKIIECVCSYYTFSFSNSILEYMEDKYPKAYFNYYIRLFCQNFETVSKENFTLYTDLYLQIEGKKGMAGLKEEIKIIQKNNDFNNLLKLVNLNPIKGFTGKQLQNAINVIQNFKA